MIAASEQFAFEAITSDHAVYICETAPHDSTISRGLGGKDSVQLQIGGQGGMALSHAVNLA